MAPSREPVLSLRATLNEMLASPFPDEGDNSEIQVAVVEACHAQSALAVRLKLTRPPAASTVGGEPIETSHPTSVGDTLESAHPPAAAAATINNVATVKRLQRQGEKSMVPIETLPSGRGNGASAIPESA
jgi:hypothetical protein